MKGSQIVDIENQLRYKYDNINSISENPSNCNKLNLLAYKAPANLQKKYSISNAIIDNNLDNEYELNDIANNTTTPITSLGFMPSTKTANQWPSFFNNNYYIEFEKIKVKTMPSGVIEMYIADKEQTNFSPSDKNFVGLFDLFTALSVAGSGANHNHSMDDGQDDIFRININEAIKKLLTNTTSVSASTGIKLPNLSTAGIKNTFEDLKNLRIHFLIRGNILDGQEVRKNVNITIGKLSLAAYKK
jgi:hypothetical protein